MMNTEGEVLLIRCPTCGVTNRVPPGKVRRHLEPVCGRCGTSLSMSAQPVTVTDASFTDLVERSPLPVLLDMWAPWCGPCRRLAPVIDEVAAELAGRVGVAKLNVDENPMTASRLRAHSIPTLLVFKGGREVDRLVGVHPKSVIMRRLRAVM